MHCSVWEPSATSRQLAEVDYRPLTETRIRRSQEVRSNGSDSPTRC
jgi:hypothetical protein